MWIDPGMQTENATRTILWLDRRLARWINWRLARKMAVATRKETKHLHWMSLRSSVASSDTLLTTTTSKNANIPSHSYTIPEGMNVPELRFLSDADGRSCTAWIHAVRKGTDDICTLCSIAITAGQQVSTGGKYYADTLTVTNLWFQDKEPKTADASGANRMARVAFDLLGYHKLFVMLDISSGVWDVEITGF